MSITLGCFFLVRNQASLEPGFFFIDECSHPLFNIFFKIRKSNEINFFKYFPNMNIRMCVCMGGWGVLYFEKLNNEVWVFWDKGQCTVFCSFVWFERILLYIIHVYSGFERQVYYDLCEEKSTYQFLLRYKHMKIYLSEFANLRLKEIIIKEMMFWCYRVCISKILFYTISLRTLFINFYGIRRFYEINILCKQKN